MTWPGIETNFRRKLTGEENTIHPRFYALSNLDINNQDIPKLDGLACNFVTGTPDKLRYPLLIDALIEILNIIFVTSKNVKPKMSLLGVCATQYCFSICWR